MGWKCNRDIQLLAHVLGSTCPCLAISTIDNFPSLPEGFLCPVQLGSASRKWKENYYLPQQLTMLLSTSFYFWEFFQIKVYYQPSKLYLYLLPFSYESFLELFPNQLVMKKILILGLLLEKSSLRQWVPNAIKQERWNKGRHDIRPEFLRSSKRDHFLNQSKFNSRRLLTFWLTINQIGNKQIQNETKQTFMIA